MGNMYFIINISQKTLNRLGIKIANSFPIGPHSCAAPATKIEGWHGIWVREAGITSQRVREDELPNEGLIIVEHEGSDFHLLHKECYGRKVGEVKLREVLRGEWVEQVEDIGIGKAGIMQADKFPARSICHRCFGLLIGE